ncbi:MAG: DUF58 domain-containing protein [Planctomycetota bacterium]|jgi:uncharacterized protein (DUF58 family)|nr:DUF58 domain-containing protein [Planctomycetota bacterium]
MHRAEMLSFAVALAGSRRFRPPDQGSGGPSGVFAGAGAGQSADFHDSREYQPGDDPRRVDWRAYARNGQLRLKQFREEVSPTVEFFLDTSASMALYPGKEETALFAVAFLRQAVLAAEGRPVLCRDGRRFSGDDFGPAWAETEFSGSGGTDLPDGGAPARPLRFFLSDYLFGDSLESWFRRRAAGSLRFVPLLILCRSEREPPWRGRRRMFDVEHPGSALDLTITGEDASRYRERLKRHEEGLEREARRLGGRLLRLDAPDRALDRGDCLAIVRRLAGEGVVTVR